MDFGPGHRWACGPPSPLQSGNESISPPPTSGGGELRRAAPFSRAPQLKWAKRHSPQVLLREMSCSFHCYPPVHPLCLYILKSPLTYIPHQLPWCLKGSNRASYHKGDRSLFSNMHGISGQCNCGTGTYFHEENLCRSLAFVI